jgi:hypothetical protein
VPSDFRALICLTSCNRALFLRRYALPFVAFCRDDRAFDFVVSLDGADGPSIAFCNQRGIPLLYSDEREGVGLAKNRALSCFGDYDYYFFVEDDVELLDSRVFREHIEVSRSAGFQHMSLFERGGAREVVRQEQVGAHRVVFARYGGAQFSLFTRAGIEAVGGWHTAFAKVRRFGHTEHSYRFVHRGLSAAPFIVIETLTGSMLWHYPTSVTGSGAGGALNPQTELSRLEEGLIADRLQFFPIQTLCPFHFNGLPVDCSRAAGVDEVARNRYPALNRVERRRARGNFLVALSRTQSGCAGWLSLLKAACYDPGNGHLRHLVKRAVMDWLRRA